ncbi:MAG: hypothetical protein KME46_21760 [Brasilonema angustatum HA4187-MV1]|jgi:hypothetical protein|nr:hypothetical protein [Brasilonema angustatum HA4187-MV1]
MNKGFKKALATTGAALTLFSSGVLTGNMLSQSNKPSEGTTDSKEVMTQQDWKTWEEIKQDASNNLLSDASVEKFQQTFTVEKLHEMGVKGQRNRQLRDELESVSNSVAEQVYNIAFNRNVSSTNSNYDKIIEIENLMDQGGLISKDKQVSAKAYVVYSQRDSYNFLESGDSAKRAVKIYNSVADTSPQNTVDNQEVAERLVKSYEEETLPKLIQVRDSISSARNKADENIFQKLGAWINNSISNPPFKREKNDSSSHTKIPSNQSFADRTKQIVSNTMQRTPLTEQSLAMMVHGGAGRS